MTRERRDLPASLEPIRDYIESIKPWDEPLEEILADTTKVQVNAPRALMACEFKGFIFWLAAAVKAGKVAVDPQARLVEAGHYVRQGGAWVWVVRQTFIMERPETRRRVKR